VWWMRRLQGFRGCGHRVRLFRVHFRLSVRLVFCASAGVNLCRIGGVGVTAVEGLRA
jgi:hypothetical protein